jgi:hypothetical protein
MDISNSFFFSSPLIQDIDIWLYFQIFYVIKF